VRRARLLVLILPPLLLLAAGLVLAAQSPSSGARGGHGGEDYCEQVRATFERTGRLARELATALESLDAEGVPATAAHLTSIRQGLEQEAALLTTWLPPPGAEEVRARGAATIALLLELADPELAHAAQGDREELAGYIRDQFLAARAEARAARAALRQGEPACASARPGQGSMRLLGRSR
jgi:hypothetical protein